MQKIFAHKFVEDDEIDAFSLNKVNKKHIYLHFQNLNWELLA